MSSIRYIRPDLAGLFTSDPSSNMVLTNKESLEDPNGVILSGKKVLLRVFSCKLFSQKLVFGKDFRRLI